MNLIELANFAPLFLLVVFRVAGVMLMSPFFSSSRVPNAFRVMLILMISLGISTGVSGVDYSRMVVPSDLITLVVAMVGEFMFGMAMGMAVSLVFTATQWAGELIGQQVGFSIGSVFDPQFGGSGSPIGDLYFMLTLLVFISVGGHRVMLSGMHESLVVLPPMALVLTPDVLALVLDLLNAATILALRLAAPVFVTLLVADIALGFLSKTMPQLNILSAGLGLRTILGMLVLIFGIASTGGVISDSMTSTLEAWVQAVSDASVAGLVKQ